MGELHVEGRAVEGSVAEAGAIGSRARARGRRAWWYPFALGSVAGMILIGLVLPFTVDESTVLSGASGPLDDGTVLGGTGEGAGEGAAGGDVAGATGPVGPGAAAGTGGTGPASGGTAGTGGAGAGGTGAGGVRTGPNTASDQGVTPTEIKVGVMDMDLGPGKALGIAFDVGDARNGYVAAINAVNAKGGIHGRKIVPVFRSFTPNRTDQAAQRSTCLALTEQAKVFAAMTNAAYYSPTCFTVEHQTPFLISNETYTDDVYGESAGMLSGDYATSNRLLRSWAKLALAGGSTNGRVVGVTSDASVSATVKKSLNDTLEAGGTPVKSFEVFSDDLTTAQSQMPLAVHDMQTKGINTVFIGTNPAITAIFVQEADSRGFRPQYLTSDFQQAASDFSYQNIAPGSAFFNAIGTTASRVGEIRAGVPEPALEAECSTNFEKTVGRPVDRRSTEYETTQHACSVVRRFAAIATLVGPDLTRKKFATAIQSVGTFEINYFGKPGRFGPRRYDAAEAYRQTRGNAQCECYLPDGDWQVPPA